MFVFRKIWRALFSWNTRFEIRPFALSPTNYYSQFLKSAEVMEKLMPSKILNLASPVKCFFLHFEI